LTDPKNTPALALGNFTAFAGESSHAPGCLVAAPIVVPREGELVELGMISKKPGPSAILGVYLDVAGSPQGIRAWTAPCLLTGSDQRIAPASPTRLYPATYWIAAEFDANASIGIDYTDKSAIVKYVRRTFGLPLPEEFPAPTVFTGQRFNCYLVLR
jgi:hypothetical protein